MIRARFSGWLILFGTLTLTASAQTAPQTARQALIEMFFGKTPGSLEKHLPEATRTALKQAPPGSGASVLQGFALLSGQLKTNGTQLQTFETGSILLQADDSRTHGKFEVLVERDNVQSEVDNIELSFHAYKNGEPQTAGVTPKLNFVMKQETGVWRLEEIALTVGVSLSNPEFLKAMTTAMKPAGDGMQAPVNGTPMAMGTMSSTNEAVAASALRRLNAAEMKYAAAYPQHGFTCSLSDLGGMGSGGEANEQHAMLISPRLASGRNNGYVFAISGCNASPASKYKVAAAPVEPNVGARAFCSDESGVLHYSLDGKAASCLSAGKLLP
jgi:type IV pilus assembly protein PilA